MRPRSLLYIALILISHGINGQFSDDFEFGSDLDESIWNGDLEHFEISNEGLLQLKAPEAGTSRIYTKTNIPDSAEWHFYVYMDFAPSGSNRVRFYLFIDTIDIESATGYFIEIGESGSEDNVKFYRLIDGFEILIAEGTPGKFGMAPAWGFIKIQRDEDDFWNFFLKQELDEVFSLELELLESTIKSYLNQYFMIECKYTSTRVEKFYFDEIYLQRTEADTKPPQLVDVNISDDFQIEVVFDEVLNDEGIYNVDNYTLEPSAVQAKTVHFSDKKPNKILLEFDVHYESNFQYTLRIDNIGDIYGNELTQPIFHQFFIVEKPEKSDVVINEILFDPYPGGSDFVELMNVSQKIVDLKGTILLNNTKEDSSVEIMKSLVLFPRQMVCITPDTLSLIDIYSIPDTAILYQKELPSLNNDSGNLSIVYDNDWDVFLIDSMNYNEDMHTLTIHDVEGVSLERVNPFISSEDPYNWHSCATIDGGATPGCQNSQYNVFPDRDIDDYVWLEKTIFSPNNDGFDDHLYIYYSLPEGGYSSTIDIFDIEGNLVQRIVNNDLMALDGFITWDGSSEDHSILPIGIYLIRFDFYNSDGRLISAMKKCILAQNF